MEISVLQSLIDRTSNQIAEYESAVEIYKSSCGLCESDFELQQNRLALKWYKSRLPKLRKIQKELKKEIAGKLKWQRVILDYKRMSEQRRETSILNEEEIK